MALETQCTQDLVEIRKKKIEYQDFAEKSMNLEKE